MPIPPLRRAEGLDGLAREIHLRRIRGVDPVGFGDLIGVNADPSAITEGTARAAIGRETLVVAYAQEWAVQGRAQPRGARVVDELGATVR